MKKVGILTFQFADNYGAVLQCYALRKTISLLPECEAEVINFCPPLFSYPPKWDSEYEKFLFNKKRELFVSFLKQYCNISGPLGYSLDEFPKYDYYCVGSDQVWSTNKRMDEFFLPNVPKGAKRISYAASLGHAPDSYKIKISTLKKYLPAFDHVSVRELVHVPLVESIIGSKCECVLDPTLLLDAEDYEPVISKEKLREDKFIFFYWLEHEPNLMRGVEMVNALSRKLEIPVVHSIWNAPEFMFTNDGGSMSLEGIENFLWYIKNAEYVITNSYHGTIFSVLFKKPFYTFVVKSMRGRIDTLCEKIGIENRVVECYLSISEIDERIDFELITENIREEKERSMLYLYAALEILE